MAKKKKMQKNAGVSGKNKAAAALIAYGRKIGRKVIPDMRRKPMDGHKRNAFFLGVLLDKGIPWEQAWHSGKIIECAFSKDDDPRSLWESIAKSDKERLLLFFKHGKGGKAFHRFYKEYAQRFPEIARRMLDIYSGDPQNIWKNQRDVRMVEERLMEFPLIGPALAKMATRLLAENHGLLGGKSSVKKIGIKPDIHVMRVFKRSGIIEIDGNAADAIHAAEELHSKYPGALDTPAWEIGKRYCRPNSPDCNNCPIDGACIKRLEV